MYNSPGWLERSLIWSDTSMNAARLFVTSCVVGSWLCVGGIGGVGGAGGFALAAAAGAAVPVSIVQFPSLSPDGTLIVYAAAGDLWAVPAAGGTATRLTSHPADERRSAISPDGGTLAFESDREGSRNIYVAPLLRTPTGIATGPIKRITFADRAQTLSGFSPDGQYILFTANLESSLYRSTRLYRVGVEGGPVERLTDAFGASPRLTPDGATLIFHRGRLEATRPKYQGAGSSDLWKLTMATGQFDRLTTSPFSDGEGFPLADGSVLYVSSRDGANHNLYKLAPTATDATAPTALTNFSLPQADNPATIGHGVRDLNVAPGGSAAVFVVWDTLYTLDLRQAGAKPVSVAISASGDSDELDTSRVNLAREVSEQALSPDGKTIALIARGEVFVRGTEEGRPTRRVTFTAGRERGLTWSPDNRVLYFASDETGPSRLYYATVSLAKDDLTPADEKAEEEKKAEEAKDEAKKDEAKKSDDKKADASDAKPADAEPKDDAAKGDDKKDEAKKPVKKKIDYAKRWSESLRFEVKPLEPEGLGAGTNDGLLGVELRSPRPSPDGTRLLFSRGLGDLVMMDLKTRRCRVLMDGWNEAEVEWAGDSRHIVYAREDEDFNSDIWLLDTGETIDASNGAVNGASNGAVNGAAVNLTKHPDLDDSPRLSADGKVLYFRSERGRENFDFGVWKVMLDKKLESLRPYELEEYFKKAAEAGKKRKPIEPVLWDQPEEAKVEAEKKDEAKAEPAAMDEAVKPDAAKPEEKKDDAAKPEEKKDEPAKKAKPKKPTVLTFDAADAWQRVRRMTTPPGSAGTLATTPGGERVVLSADGDPERTLYSISYKGDDRKSIQVGAVSEVSVSLDGTKVAFIRTGQASLAPVSGGKAEPMTIDAPVVIEVAAQQKQKFLEAARIMGNGFYHFSLKGLNWKALTERYQTLAIRARTNQEFDRVFTMMLGELDGSHTGINGPSSFTAASPATGYLGADFTMTAQGPRVRRVITGSPADKKTSKLEVGDVIRAVDGRDVAGLDIADAMLGKSGREVLLTIDRGSPAVSTTVLIVPTGSGEDSDLRYRQEVLDRRAEVEQLSGGTLGYLHIRAMSQASVDDFERDLFAAAQGKRGLVIDVRDNGGGSTADILLASLTAPQHSYTAPRGVDPSKAAKDAYPRDRRLIYGYSRPISVLCNENSFSNAEIFSHAIKTIGRGKLVGTATYGGVISTGAATLIDGTTLRTPFRGWFLTGTDADMENNGAKPDINVPQLPAEEVAGVDAQLEAAVKELMGRAK